MEAPPADGFRYWERSNIFDDEVTAPNGQLAGYRFPYRYHMGNYRTSWFAHVIRTCETDKVVLCLLAILTFALLWFSSIFILIVFFPL